MYTFTIFAALALTALTTAIPHAGHNHRHAHLHPRAQSGIGQCGGDQGYTCGPGFCCSEWGYCGKSEEYCGTGCNPKWGTCGGNSTVSGTASGTIGPTATSYVSSSTSLVIPSTSETLSSSSEIVPATTSVVSSATEPSSASSSVLSVAANTKAFSHPGWPGRPSWGGPPASAWSTSTVEHTSTTEASPSTTSVPAETTSIAAPSTTLATSYSAPPPAPSPYSAPESTSTWAPAPSSYSAPETTSTSAPAPSSYSAPETSTWAPAPSSYSAPSTTSSAPATTSSSSSSGSSGSDSYTVYLGDGTTAQGWPDQSAWVSFDSMWSANMAYISISCAQFGQTDNSDTESDDIKTSIQSVASSSGVDERFILAIMMQESKGCVRTPTTNYGVNNPGLMQSHDGTGSCNNGNAQEPCPDDQIEQMIKDGTTGTAAGDGLQQVMSQSGASDVSKYYKAARMYNSGSVAASGLLQDGIATHCYASDIANRLTGWVKAATTCDLG